MLPSLLREIVEYCPFIGDESQKGRIEQLVALGPSIVPEVERAVRNVIQRGRSTDEFKNAGLLSEAIGKMGGPGAYEILVGLATQESRAMEYRFVREGAIRGLSYLRDERAADILARLAQSDPEVAGVVDDALRVIGVEAMRRPAIPSAPAWAGDARTWDRIAEAFRQSQVQMQQPDFKGLSQIIERFDDPLHRHAVWNDVAYEFRHAGKIRTALQCWVEALRHYPDPDCVSAWGNTANDLNELPLEETQGLLGNHDCLWLCGRIERRMPS